MFHCGRISSSSPKKREKKDGSYYHMFLQQKLIEDVLICILKRKEVPVLRTHWTLTRIVPLLLISTILNVAEPTMGAHRSPYEWAFVRLDYARKGKVEQLKRFLKDPLLFEWARRNIEEVSNQQALEARRGGLN